MRLTKENKKSLMIAFIGAGIAVNLILPTFNGISLLVAIISLLYVYLKKRKDLEAWLKKLQTIELAMVQIATYLIIFWATMNFIRWLFTVFH